MCDIYVVEVVMSTLLAAEESLSRRTILLTRWACLQLMLAPSFVGFQQPQPLLVQFMPSPAHSDWLQG